VPSAGFGDSSGREFGTLLRHARERAWLSQQQLADRCGLSVRTINNLESGRVARPRIQSVQLLADELELSNSERSAFEQAALGQVGGPPPIPGFHPAPCLLPPDAPDFIGRAEQTSALIDTLTRPGAGDRKPQRRSLCWSVKEESARLPWRFMLPIFSEHSSTTASCSSTCARRMERRWRRRTCSLVFCAPAGWTPPRFRPGRCQRRLNLDPSWAVENGPPSCGWSC
jgi:transcriptional regulator with XRE-family HTH domain